MPLDLEKVDALYDKLEEKANGTVEKFIETYSIKESDKATIISSVINNLITLSVTATQQQELNDAQVSDINASKDLKTQQKTNLANEDSRANGLNAKEILLKQAQTDLTIIERQVKEYEFTEILPVQKSNLAKDGTVKTNQAELITRQKTAYDDNLRVEEAKCITNVIAGYGFNGTVVEPGLQTTALNAINAITP